jgi:cyclopropane-fatty-acyl-phospholipid synthase
MSLSQTGDRSDVSGLRSPTDRMLRRAFGSIIRHGHLKLVTPSGATLTFGDGTGPKLGVRIPDQTAAWRLLLDPELAIGELFTDGRLQMENGSIAELIDLLLREAKGVRAFLPTPHAIVRKLAWRFSRRNSAVRARSNVAHHYDLDGKLYDLFLDPDRQYSCAYFETPGQDLHEAQRAKMRHVTAKLALRPGQAVLDIGSGWGGLAHYLAEIGGAGSVLGVTLSEEQLTYSRRRVEQAGLSDRVSFALKDYRSVAGRFDRIVSVGMFEHVGPADYSAFFETCHRLLAEDGVALVHTIARSGEPWHSNPWVSRYIFPGGHIPTLSEIAPVLERSGLILTDLEVLRLHYSWTLRAWRERFMARREEARALYDERFCRMWEFYLAAFEVAFRREDLVVFQLQLSKRNDTLPMRRGYIERAEGELQQAEARLRP